MADSLNPQTLKQFSQYSSGGNVASALTDSGDHPHLHQLSRSQKIAVKSDPLGSIAESSSHAKKSDDQSPVDVAIKQRYRLLRRAAKLLPDSRIAQCSWRPSPQASYVVGYYKPDQERSYYANLQQCNKPFCPICGIRRAEETAHELRIALAMVEKRGLFALLITATVRHHAGDDLKELKQKLAKAWDGTFSGRWYDDLIAEYGIQGKTKSWEVTYGRNGFHPHIHSLMVMELELAGKHKDEFEARVKARFIEQLAKLGLDATWKHGLTVETADSKIAEYIAKFGREPLERTWGVESEVARAAVKKAHKDGLTPLELLAAADGQDEPLARLSAILGITNRDELKQRAGALYRQVFAAFERTAIIHWGKSLRQSLELDQALMDFAAANPVQRDDVPMVLIAPGDDWKKVLALPDGRAELRAVVRTGDAFKVMVWLGRHGINAIVPEVAIEFTLARDADQPVAGAKWQRCHSVTGKRHTSPVAGEAADCAAGRAQVGAQPLEPPALAIDGYPVETQLPLEAPGLTRFVYS